MRGLFSPREYEELGGAQQMKLTYYGFCPMRNGTVGLKLDICEAEDLFGIMDRRIEKYECTHQAKYGCDFHELDPDSCPLYQEADVKLCGHLKVRPTA